MTTIGRVMRAYRLSRQINDHQAAVIRKDLDKFIKKLQGVPDAMFEPVDNPDTSNSSS